MKQALIACIVVFVAIETAVVAWCLSVRPSFGEAVALAFKEPATWMMLVDFALFGTIVFFWMVFDSKKRGKNGWLWLPGMILAPTVALAAYLLARGSYKDA
jgi:hypothetical protein